MEVLKLCVLLLMALFMVFSCMTTPKPEIQEPLEVIDSGQLTQESTDTVKPDFGVVSDELYNSTKIEVRNFIEGLNNIISSKNYKAWVAVLSPEYLNMISSPENLDKWSQLPAMKTRNIKLKTTEDYFINVVVPSRTNIMLDDIEFIGKNRVKAFSVQTNKAGEEQRLRLYDLEKAGDSWIIIN